MELSDIKWWQWAMIGLIVGLGMGYMWSGPDNGDAQGRQISQVDFERDLTRKNEATGHPILRHIVVQPETTDYALKRVQPVTFERLYVTAKTRQEYYSPEQFIAMVPYKPAARWNSKFAAGGTVVDYLNALKAANANANVSFGYGWYNERPMTIAIWTVACTVLIGGIWPMVLNLIVGAGLTGVREKKKKEDYFDRFSHGPEQTAVAKPVATAEQHQELDDMNAMLEERLAASGVMHTDPADDADVSVAEASVRKLEAGPLEAASIAKPVEQDDIEVKGDFYPVLIHHKKQADERPKEPEH